MVLGLGLATDHLLGTAHLSVNVDVGHHVLGLAGLDVGNWKCDQLSHRLLAIGTNHYPRQCRLQFRFGFGFGFEFEFRVYSPWSTGRHTGLRNFLANSIETEIYLLSFFMKYLLEYDLFVYSYSTILRLSRV